MVNEKSLANLKKIRKGQVLNPDGRSGKNESLSDLLRRELKQVTEENPELSNAQAIAKALVKRAVAGHMDAIELIYERLEGKPVAPVDLKSDGKEIKPTFTFVLPDGNSVTAEQMLKISTG